jgi:hypothetical protein
MPRKLVAVSYMTDEQLWRLLKLLLIELEPGNMHGLRYAMLRGKWIKAGEVAEELRMRGVQLQLDLSGRE